MSFETRRSFIAASGKVLVGALALGSLAAQASEEHAHAGPGQGLVVDATLENRCATCQFWGGMRKISDDNKEIVAQSMGWCNNPKSPNHKKLTTADHEMKKTGIWQKWAAL
jgi:hypothetical protein